MVPFNTFFYSLYHHTHETTRILAKVIAERSHHTFTSFENDFGTLLPEERGHRNFSNHG